MKRQYIEPEVDLIEIHSGQLVCTSYKTLGISVIDDIEEDEEQIVL
ncbi:MAG: hypothetical protein ACI3ZK_04580 [Candidatus Cryptobacteroides sp.]